MMQSEQQREKAHWWGKKKNRGSEPQDVRDYNRGSYFNVI